MGEIQQYREIIRMLRKLIEAAEPHERPAIRIMIRNRSIRLALLLLQKELESAIGGPFDSIASQKLDAVDVLLRD